MGKYDDIIDMERPKSNHPKMDLIKRSAQFAPFSSLNGYEDEIKETGRIVDKKIELDDDTKEHISEEFNIIKYHLNEKPIIKITYFQYDELKDGGKYVAKKGYIKKINEIKKEVVLDDNTIIKMNDIKDISGDIIDEYWR